MVHFLVAEGAETREILCSMSPVYGEHRMSLTSVQEWQKRFCEGRTSLQDDSRPGQVHRAITPDVIARIDDLIRENRRITEEQEWVRLCIHQRPTSFYKTGIEFLVLQWDKRINTSGNYF